METLQQYIHIARLIIKEKFGKLTETEKRQLHCWKETCERHCRDYKALEQVDAERVFARYERISPEQGWVDFHKRLQSARRVRYWRRTAVAASVCLLLGAAGLFFRPFGLWEVPVAELTLEDRQGVRLILPDGESLNLSLADSGGLQKVPGEAVATAGKLEYSRDSVEAAGPEWNTLLVPKGAFYHLILSDGTRVWLNADTKIVYPMRFAGDLREVNLSGEAFFEVSKDPDHPFVVRTDGFSVKVLGTSFNVNTYGDDGKIYTALQEGVVEVSESAGNSVILAPGQVAELDMRRPGALLQLSAVSLEQQMAWKEGFFCFRHTSLEEILKQVGRYYDVVFRGAEYVTGEYYTGDISRTVSLEALLAAIGAQTTDVEFKTVDRIVYIMKKRD